MAVSFLIISGTGLVLLLKNRGVGQENLSEVAEQSESAEAVSEGEGVRLEVIDTRVEEAVKPTTGGSAIMTDEEMDNLDSEVDQLTEDLDILDEPEIEFEID